MPFDVRAILEILPHRPPFLFLDEIEELSPERGRARYRYREDESFFAGHFPGDPVVPGVIQIETMAQLVVAVGLVAAREARVGVERIAFSIATDCQFHRRLGPGEEVVVAAERLWFRMRAIQCKATLHRASDGALCAEATIRGSG
jgi:3-hydroxyacyl-[acyl-carrier-protein] dehydratase